MKLLFCLQCQDVVKLKILDVVTCSCGACSGVYWDSLNAMYHGDALPIGFGNGSLSAAIRAQVSSGDSTEAMFYGGDYLTKGRSFDAFIIPESAPTYKKVTKEKFESVLNEKKKDILVSI